MATSQQQTELQESLTRSQEVFSEISMFLIREQIDRWFKLELRQEWATQLSALPEADLMIDQNLETRLLECHDRCSEAVYERLNSKIDEFTGRLDRQYISVNQVIKSVTDEETLSRANKLLEILNGSYVALIDFKDIYKGWTQQLIDQDKQVIKSRSATIAIN